MAKRVFTDYCMAGEERLKGYEELEEPCQISQEYVKKVM